MVPAGAPYCDPPLPTIGDRTCEQVNRRVVPTPAQVVGNTPEWVRRFGQAGPDFEGWQLVPWRPRCISRSNSQKCIAVMEYHAGFERGGESRAGRQAFLNLLDRRHHWMGCFAYGLETQAFPSFQFSFGLQPIFQVMALDGATFQEECMRANGNLLLTRRSIAGCVQLNFGKIDWIGRHVASSTEEKRGYQPLPF
jgi:hypothetical protein